MPNTRVVREKIKIKGKKLISMLGGGGGGISKCTIYTPGLTQYVRSCHLSTVIPTIRGEFINQVEEGNVPFAPLISTLNAPLPTNGWSIYKLPQIYTENY